MKPYLNSRAEKGVDLTNWLPARLDVPTVSKLLGFADYEIPVLITEGLLEPLGKPAQNAPKFFARVQIEELAENSAWLHKATAAISKYWRNKRQRQQENHGHGQFGLGREDDGVLAAV